MPVFPSEEWLDEFVEKINGSAEYAAAAATWEGDLVFVYEKEPDKGVDEDVYAWLDLWHGKCRDSARLEGPDDPKAKGAKFTISAPYSRWKSVVKKELDPVKGMMRQVCLSRSWTYSSTSSQECGCRSRPAIWRWRARSRRASMTGLSPTPPFFLARSDSAARSGRCHRQSGGSAKRRKWE